MHGGQKKNCYQLDNHMPSPKFYAPGRRGNGLGSERQTTDGLGFGASVMGTMVTIIPGLSATALQMHL